MRAVVCNSGELSVRDVAEPRPGPGQVLVSVTRCGICGSDLHARRHCEHMGRLLAKSGYAGFMQPGEDVILGHEICGEVLETGKGAGSGFAAGTRVVALPLLRRGDEVDMLGFSARSGGGYAERMVVQGSMAMPVPNGLSDNLAAMTEPTAVGWHAVRRSEARRRDVAIVIGCGPVGLAVICALKARGVAFILAADFSPARRALATACGAYAVIDPAAQSPYADWRSFGFVGDANTYFQLAFDTRDRLGRTPLPWWHAWRVAEALGAAPKRPLIFECVGVPGVLQNIIDGAPMFSRVVVAGVCMESDRIEPAMAIQKEIELRFVFGYSPLEFRDTLHLIAEGKLDPAPMLTGKVGLDGVAAAFDALGSPELHAKILVAPASDATVPVAV